MTNLVLVDRADHVARLTLNRPERYNAFDPGLIRAVRETFEHEAAKDATWAIVVTGAGKAFCAGGDVAAMRDRIEDDPQGLFMTLTADLHPLIEAIRQCPKPVVAAVNGPVAGGGLGVALACDWRTAGPTASFKPAYAKLGIVPDGGSTYFLPRLVGWGAANRIILSDASVPAEEAARLGLVDELVAEHEVLNRAHAAAARLAALPAETFAETKRLLNTTHTASLKEQLDLERRLNAESAGRPALREGVAAFFEKRMPMFRKA